MKAIDLLKRKTAANVKRMADAYDRGGIINIGRNITIYWGNSAMHWAVNWWTKKYGYICWRPAIGRQKAYFYVSPNGTPWASTFYIGPDKDEYVQSRIRKTCFGHNWDPDGWDEEYQLSLYEIMRGINRSVSWSRWQYAKYQMEHPDGVDG